MGQIVKPQQALLLKMITTSTNSSATQSYQLLVLKILQLVLISQVRRTTDGRLLSARLCAALNASQPQLVHTLEHIPSQMVQPGLSSQEKRSRGTLAQDQMASAHGRYRLLELTSQEATLPLDQPNVLISVIDQSEKMEPWNIALVSITQLTQACAQPSTTFMASRWMWMAMH